MAEKRHLNPTLWVAAIAAILTAGSAAAGQFQSAPGQAASAELRRTVDRLVDQLGADALADRTDAERELLRLGTDILDVLPPPELLDSLTAREAVRRIRIRLERTKARRSVEASRVTLERAAPLDELIHAVSQQTGNWLDVSKLPESLRSTEFHVNFQRVPFWTVVDRLGTRAGLSYRLSPDASVLVFEPHSASDNAELATSVSGAFRLAVRSARLRPLIGDDQHRLLKLEVNVTAEPRLRPLFLKSRGRDLAAFDPEQNGLPQFNPDASIELPLGEGGRTATVRTSFRVPATKKISAVRLAGRVQMLTAAGTERIEFTQLDNAQGVARRRGGVTVRLQDVQATEDDDADVRARFRVAVAYDAGGPAFESHRTWIFHNRAYLEDRSGRRIERNSQFHTALQADGAVAVEYNFDGLRQPLKNYRFVYVAPTLIVNVPVEMAFESIPVAVERP